MKSRLIKYYPIFTQVTCKVLRQLSTTVGLYQESSPESAYLTSRTDDCSWRDSNPRPLNCFRLPHLRASYLALYRLSLQGDGACADSNPSVMVFNMNILAFWWPLPRHPQFRHYKTCEPKFSFDRPDNAATVSDYLMSRNRQGSCKASSSLQLMYTSLIMTGVLTKLTGL